MEEIRKLILAEEVEQYAKYLSNFLTEEYITEENLRSLNIKSIKMIQEVFSDDPLPPLMIVEKLDGTVENIKGYVDIPRYLNKLFHQLDIELEK